MREILSLGVFDVAISKTWQRMVSGPSANCRASSEVFDVTVVVVRVQTFRIICSLLRWCCLEAFTGSGIIRETGIEPATSSLGN